MLSWFETRAEEEVPPEHLWEDDDGLELWWREIEERKGISSESGTPLEETQGLVGNDLAAAFKQ